MLKDFRYALRVLLRSPGFTAVALLSLALGIGGITAIFSMVSAILLRPLAYRKPDRLYTVWETVPKLSRMSPTLPVSASHFLEWRRQCAAFEGMAAIESQSFALTRAGEPERLGGARVSANFFSLLGVQPQLGRAFLPEEDQPGRDRVVVISDSLWRRRFQADPALIGKTIHLDDQAYTVAGVLPRNFPFPRGRQLHQLVSFEAQTDVFKPMSWTSGDIVDFGEFNYAVVARLKDGVTPEEARAELNAIQARLAQQIPEHVEMGAVLTPLQEALVGKVRQGMLLLLAAVGAVLLIVCVNIANLLLSRMPLRGREMALRAALGAGRRRLIAQLLSESLVLALAGGALGALLALWGVDVLRTRIPVDLPRLEEVRVDGSVLLFTFLISVGAGLLFGIAPALRVSRQELSEALKEGGRGSSEGSGGARLRRMLVALEVGLSVVLLAGGGLLLRSFVRLMHVDKGFQVERVVAVDLGLPATRYSEHVQRQSFYRRVIEGVSTLPGVQAAGVINTMPLSKESNVSPFQIEGAPPLPVLERPIADFRFVSPGYFQAIGIPLRRGRIFDESDSRQRVAVINEKMARTLWPGEDPVGKGILHGEGKMPIRIVGVVGDIRNSGLDKAPGFMLYQPYWQRDPLNMSLVVRAAGDPRAFAAVLRREVWKADPEVPVPELRTMAEVVSQSVSQRRFQTLQLVLFAAVALLLASIGIYGVVSHSVARRTHEIGIRMALGAQPRDVVRLVSREGLLPVAAGLVIGAGAALALGRILASLLYGISSHDPLTFVAVALLLAMAALFACWVPARRAIRVDPIVALRYE